MLAKFHNARMVATRFSISLHSCRWLAKKINAYTEQKDKIHKNLKKSTKRIRSAKHRIDCIEEEFAKEYEKYEAILKQVDTLADQRPELIPLLREIHCTLAEAACEDL